MKKLILSIVTFTFALCCFCGIDAKAESISGYYPAVSLKVPKMSQYPQACGIACMGQGEGYFFDQTDRKYSDSAVYSLVVSYNKANVSANWSNVGYLKKGASSESEYLTALYNQLAAGYPVIVFRRNNETEGTHYATVYEYSGSTSSLTRGGFKVVSTNTDFAYVSKESLSTFLSGATPIDVYDKTYSNKYKYIVRRSGITNPSSLVSGITFAVNHPPLQHAQGTMHPVLGTISSNNKITSVTVGVYDLAGNKKFAASAAPNAKYYDINKLDGSMTFKSLAAGNYDYKITATDSSGKTKTFTWRFGVSSSASTSTMIKFTYNPVNAVGTIAPQTVAYGGSLVVASGDHLVRTGYTLQGFAAYRCSDKTYFTTAGLWQTQSQINANGYTKKAYQSGTSYTINSSWVTNPYVDNEFILAAMWKANVYTVKYDANGGKGTMSDETVTYGNASSVAQNTFTKNGAVFGGWNIYSSSLGKWLYTNGSEEGWYVKNQQPAGYTLAVYDAGDSLSHIDTADGDVLRLIAIWNNNELPFVDVKTDSWYYDYVAYAYYNSLMTGTSDTIFEPDSKLSRAQFAMILYRMNGSPQVEYQPTFPDVAEGSWYADAVLWANENGIILGYSDGKFGPSDNITREQMAVMMYRYANEIEGSDIGAIDGSIVINVKWAQMSVRFTDVDKVSSYALDAVKWAVVNDLIRGNADGSLNPRGNATRAECAAIIERFTEM